MTGFPVQLGPRDRSGRTLVDVGCDEDTVARAARLRRRIATATASSGFLLGLVAIAAALESSRFL